MRSKFKNKSHPNCQIIYVVGVEGSAHHGASEVIASFAKRQVDGEGKDYVVHFRNDYFREVIDWLNGKNVKKVAKQVRRDHMHQLCNDGRRHVIIEDNSFPSGSSVRGQWKNMTATEIASSLKKHPHPIDLKAFAQDFSPFADVRYVVLHRPFINTVVAHHDFGGNHATVIRGNLMYLAELLRGSGKGGKRAVGGAPWTLLCVDQLSNSRNSKVDGATATPRERILADLSHFLRWHHPDCPRCFAEWKDSTKDPEIILGQDGLKSMKDEREKLMGIWPPTLVEEGTLQQDCPL